MKEEEQVPRSLELSRSTTPHSHPQQPPFIFQDNSSARDDSTTSSCEYQAGSEASSVRRTLLSSNGYYNSTNNTTHQQLQPQLHSLPGNSRSPALFRTRFAPQPPATVIASSSPYHNTPPAAATSSSTSHRSRPHRPLQDRTNTVPVVQPSASTYILPGDTSATSISSVTSASVTSAASPDTTTSTSRSSSSDTSSIFFADRSAEASPDNTISNKKQQHPNIAYARSSSHKTTTTTGSSFCTSSHSNLDLHYFTKHSPTTTTTKKSQRFSKMPPTRQDGGEESTNDAEISNLTTSSGESSPASSSSSSSSGFSGSLLHPTSTKQHHSSSLYATPPKPRNLLDDDNNNNKHDKNNDDTVDPSCWSLSPGISTSIPEQQKDFDRPPLSPAKRNQARVAAAAGSSSTTDADTSKNGATTTTSSSSSIVPSTSTTTSIISTATSIASPQLLKSSSSLLHLGGGGGGDNSNSSFAAYSVASGYHSEATGFTSASTLVIRNTSGKPGTKKVPPRGGDIEAGSNNALRLATIPSSHDLAVAHDNDDTSAHPHHHHHHRNKERSRTQNLIICFLTSLFLLGMLTVVVSYVLSQQGTRTGAGVAEGDGITFLDDGVVDYSGKFFGDDDFDNNFFPNNNNNNSTDDETNSTLLDGEGGPKSPLSLPFAEASPTTAPSFDQEGALFADAVEELLQTITPTTTASPPTPSPTTTAPITSNPTTSTPTTESLPIIGVSLTATTASPTTNIYPTLSPTARPTHNPTTTTTTEMKPTVSQREPPPPLLQTTTNLQQEAQLLGERDGDAAGSSIALSGNGQVVVVGSPNAGANESDHSGLVQVFERRPTNNNNTWEWSPRGVIEGVEALNQLGFGVAASDDGSIIAVSEPKADSSRGRVLLFEWQEPERQYVVRQQLVGAQTTDHFGVSISLSGTGHRLAVGSPYASPNAIPGESERNLRGKVDVYEYSESSQQWEPMQPVDNPDLLLGTAGFDWFGWAVSLSRDGQVLAVGAPRNTEFGGYVQCFQWTNQNGWEYMGSPILNSNPPVKPDDRFGHSVSVTNTGTSETNNSDGSIARVAVGAPWKDIGNLLNSGMVAVYEYSNTNQKWVLDTDGSLGEVLVADEPGFYDQFGFTVQIEGDVVAVGVPGWDNRRGRVDLFWLKHAFSPANTESSSSWDRLSSPLTGNAAGDDFGYSVSLSALSSEPSSLFVAAGAIMVSESAPASPGYTEVFRAGNSS